jgi:acyl carrier protein
MNKERILADVAEVIRDVVDLPGLTVNSQTTAESVEEWDSFNHINIVVAIEARFGIKFLAAEIEQLKNVGDLTALIEEKLSARKMG